MSKFIFVSFPDEAKACEGTRPLEELHAEGNVVYVKVFDIYGAGSVAERLSELLDCDAKSWSSEFPSFVTSLQAQPAEASRSMESTFPR